MLFRSDTIANLAAAAKGAKPTYRLIRPRVLVYAGALALVGVVMLVAFAARTTVELSVLRDRAPLFVTLSDGSIRNGYTIKILNKTPAAQRYALDVRGIPSAAVQVISGGEAPTAGIVLEAHPDSVSTYRVYVTARADAVLHESVPVTFRVRAEGGTASADRQSVFLGPDRD